MPALAVIVRNDSFLPIVLDDVESATDCRYSGGSHSIPSAPRLDVAAEWRRARHGRSQCS